MRAEAYERLLRKYGPDDPGLKVIKASLDKQAKARLGRSAQLALRRGFPDSDTAGDSRTMGSKPAEGSQDHEEEGVVSEARQAMDKPWPREATGTDGRKYRLTQTGASSWQISVLTKKNRWKREVCGSVGAIQYWGRRQREAGDIQLPRKLGLFVGGGKYKQLRSLDVGGITTESQDRLTDDSGGPGRSRLRSFTTRTDIWLQNDGTFAFHGSRNSPGYNGHSFSSPGGLRSLRDLELALQRHAVRLWSDDRRTLETIRQIWLDRRAEEKARRSPGADQSEAE